MDTERQAEGHVGKAIVSSLEAHGVHRVFSVPGESFLAVLDGLYESEIENVVARQEGGATYMAEAHGKLTGEPGIALVTRGPGAANAFVGIHTAFQDATPLVLLVGMIPVADRGRESFQEFNPSAWFGTQTKQVFMIDDPQRASEIIAEAFFAARSGRPGPVVVGLPEDILRTPFRARISGPLAVAQGAVSLQQIREITEALEHADTPLIYAGGPRWSASASQRVDAFAQKFSIPVIHEWRSTDRIPYSSPANAGWLGYGRAASPAEMFNDADVVIAIGAAPTDVPSDGYTLRQDPEAKNFIVSLDPGLQGRTGQVSAHILATPHVFAQELDAIELPRNPARETWFQQGTEAYRKNTVPASAEQLEPGRAGTAHMAQVMAELRRHVPEDLISVFGAGNHCVWPQYYMPTETFPSQLGTRNGSMGYSIPGAVAASLEQPERMVIAVSGDGEFLMNGQELATASQYGAAFLVLVVDNQEYGTIRKHQEHYYPGRVSGTQLSNPDFSVYAQAFGAHTEQITDDAEIPAALDRAVEAVKVQRRVAVVHIVIDQRFSTP